MFMQKFKLIIILFILLQFLCTSCAKNPVRISHVSVLNSNFAVIREIDDQSILDDLNRIWYSRTQIAYSDDPLFPVSRFTYRLDIKTEKGSERWLYDSDGYVSVLSKTNVPVFKLTDPDSIKNVLVP